MANFTNDEFYAVMHLCQTAQYLLELRKLEYAKAGTDQCVRINEWNDAYNELEKAIDLLTKRIEYQNKTK